MFGATVSREAVTSPLAISKAACPQRRVIDGPSFRDGGLMINPCPATVAAKSAKLIARAFILTRFRVKFDSKEGRHTKSEYNQINERSERAAPDGVEQACLLAGYLMSEPGCKIGPENTQNRVVRGEGFEADLMATHFA